MVLIFLFIFFIVVKESWGGRYNFVLIDAPKIFELVNNCCLFVKWFHDLLSCHVIQSEDTIADSGRFEYLNPSDFRSVVSMSTAACFNINVLNVYDSDSISWDDTSLIETESVLLLSSFFIFEIFCDGMAFENNFIGLVFDFHLFLLRNWLIMGDVNMSIVLSLFSTVLPNMGT